MLYRDAIVVLAGFLTKEPERALSEEDKLRLDRGIELYKERGTDYMIMSSGAGRFLDGSMIERNSRPLMCHRMKEYAVEKGVPEHRVLMEEYSLDTVGEAFFGAEVMRWYGIKRATVVSSDYHMDRVKMEFGHMAGPETHFDYEGVDVSGALDGQTLEERKRNEQLSMALFRDQFHSFRPGDRKGMEKSLWAWHPLYSRIPEDDRLKFYDV